MIDQIVNYDFGAHVIDWQILLGLIFFHFMVMMYSMRSKEYKLAFGVLAAITLVMIVSLV